VAPGRRAADLRAGYQRLAARRRRDQPGAGPPPFAVAAELIRALLGRLPANGPVPLFVFDAGYGPMKLARELGDLDGEWGAALVRLRSGRCFYADPDRQPRTGRPRRHGRKLTCDDPTTWWAPTAEHRDEHAQYGTVRVRAWADVHAKTQNRPTRGSRGTRPLA
jgi:hypothetical protein